ncbi:MAG: type VI secretion system ImpA family N-terminal domain-containing protein, partial [Planctomycetes bacterium]|nr:type VI secretion system ImpA family N-terminal domain-containing protein [Planctomycetota bacterium]
MSNTIDLTTARKIDTLELLRPIPGPDAPAGCVPDSNNAPRVEGQNILIWLNDTRKRAIALDEEKAGLPKDGAPDRENEHPALLWENIIRASQSFLLDYGRDIRVTFYCLEGWLRRDGLAGLAQGLLLLRGMLAAYWETLHPVPREGAEEDRRQDCLASYFAVRDDQALEYTPLFLALNLYVPVADDGKGEPNMLGECLEAGVTRPDAALIPERVRVAAGATDPLLGRAWLAAARAAIHECAAYETLVAGLRFSFGPAPMPPIRKLRQRLEETAAVLTALYDRQEGTAAESTDENAEVASIREPERLAEQLLTNKRSDNLRLLRALGRCFRNNEPHSPVGYALSHWADMAEKSLPELLDAIGFVADKERVGLQEFTGSTAPRGRA